MKSSHGVVTTDDELWVMQTLTDQFKTLWFTFRTQSEEWRGVWVPLPMWDRDWNELEKMGEVNWERKAMNKIIAQVSFCFFSDWFTSTHFLFSSSCLARSVHFLFCINACAEHLLAGNEYKWNWNLIERWRWNSFPINYFQCSSFFFSENQVISFRIIKSDKKSYFPCHRDVVGS